MSLTRSTTLAVAVMVLGALGGGIGVAARQLGIEPASKEVQAQPPPTPARKVSRSGEVVSAVVGPQSPTNPARKALKAAEDGILEYETQLKTARTEILKLNAQLAILKAHIVALESRGKAEAARGPAAGAGANPTRATPGGRARNGGPGGDDPTHDTISTGREAIVSTSAAGDRVVIYSTRTGMGRTYRPPMAAKIRMASAFSNFVFIAAMGPGVTQLAAYSLDKDEWAIQDLHGDIDSTEMCFGEQLGRIAGIAFRSKNLTQLAVFDFNRFRWSVRDLTEPFDEGYAAPWISGSLAVYTLGRHVYAYSTEAGRWDALALDNRLIARRFPGAMASFPEGTDNSVAVAQGGRLHVFTARTGRWQTIDPKD